ncbi:hypothetical protein HJC23_003402 [Cyclotella cryptica]|uniref:DUF1279 domain-containing protein n=1 Tax=Cyclotella cryptica TaxID=29204 RepID=A0ABD3QRL5_9STRA|eukprot:CCRYP_002531-RA/>CCRYP_002531-RA protein AED:0.25 eAED:0.25 QI:0/-1/0/1/-1/1/1/0/130
MTLQHSHWGGERVQAPCHETYCTPSTPPSPLHLPIERHPIKPPFALHVLQTEEGTTQKPTTAEETTQKYGIEAGLFQSLRSQGGKSAKSLLAKYGIAYLAISIQLAILSLVLCYVLVNRGVNMGTLLSLI